MDSEKSLAVPTGSDGFAQSAGTPAGTVIHTDEVDLVAGYTTIATQGDRMPAYLARPAGQDQHLPVILVIQEIFGVHEHIRDLCRRLAKQGYLALAPELYFRQGNPDTFQDIPTLSKQLVAKVPDAQVLSDLDHSAHWAASHGGDNRRLGITGFCWGGRITWLYAAHNPQVKAAVAWYGKLVGEKSLLIPRYPIDVAAALAAPVLGLYGGLDTSISLDSVEAMRQAVNSAKSDSEIIVYPDAGHAFNADYRPSYHAASAIDGWRRMLAWFDKYGVK
ncbi:dienelactone hydrolase family protein [Acerihabitans sp. TG2]|uniref:dienelactone hydrolase family protein n=1 Tax=Acerihabitans sp. TG2 TaxID=3096008 RepID=UPI002B22DC72|nr:dienelactone hydrolase family protein [Acerihabitans sp. TG2]MEA9389840.1 dienelactone hydrolase family protein [Acerihabitans sp. TG2]